jgi:hypothetical protein
MQEDIDLFIKEYTEAQEVHVNKAKGLLIELVHQFWDNNPEVNLITWAQYTPYFNDADACTFRVEQVILSNAKEKEDYEDIHYGEYNGTNSDIWVVEESNRYSRNEIDKGSAELVESFIYKLQELNLLQQMFGEDSLVIITRDDGIMVENYSDRHD